MRAVRFGILGPLRAWRTDVEVAQELDLGPPQQRLVLAVLLARAGEVVSVDDLVDVLWEADAPASAMNVIHRHIGMLRRLLEPELPARASGRWLVRQGPGYVLRVDAESADILAFRQLCGRARTAVDSEAMALYGQAFQLWRGPCADGLAVGPQAQVLFTAIDNDCTAAAGAMAEVALRCGRAADALPILRGISPRDPLNERLHAQLMLVLAASGNQAEALAVYRTMTERLAGELGIDPGPDLRAAYTRILRQETPAPSVPTIKPAQLPMDLSTFGGRQHVLNAMRKLLTAEAAVSIVAIDGMPGAGKTTTAVRLAHELVDRYPDGQLYVNLRGFDPSGLAIDPSTVLLRFLTALGVQGDRVPPDLEGQAALYRTCLAGKRMLVVLDNARDVEQILPLLPGSPTCLVIATSRNRLTGLVAMEGARPFTLEPVPSDEAREILALRLGAARGQDDAVDRIVAICGGLPLALAIVAARAAIYPDLPLSAIAAELSATPANLDALSQDEARGVRAVFSWSYQALRPQAALLFRLLSTHPGPDISARACASLLGVPVRDGQAAIAELSRTRLVTEHVPGRFLLHDLVRAYSMELTNEVDPPTVRDEAVERMLEFYLHSAHAANVALQPTQIVPLGPLRAGVTPDGGFDSDTASRWLAAEYPILLMSVRQAIEVGRVDIAWQLAFGLQTYQHNNGLLRDWAGVAEAALAAAHQAGDHRGEMVAERSLAGACFMLGDGRQALRHLQNALEKVIEHGWLAEEGAYVERNFGEVLLFGSPNVPADREASIRHFRRAQELYQAMGHKQGMAYAIEGLAVCHMLMNEYERSIELLEEALMLHRDLADRNGEGYAYARMADNYLRLDRLAEALALVDRAIDLHTAGRHRLMQIEDLVLLGDIQVAQQELTAARQAWEQALSLAELFGASARIAELRERLSRVSAH